jgi:hypothetical protein
MYQVLLWDRGNIMVPKHLAFLRMYKVLPTSQLNELVKCKQLTWDLSKDSSYLVADVASILWVIHIVPNFLQDGHFFSMNANFDFSLSWPSW